MADRPSRARSGPNSTPQAMVENFVFLRWRKHAGGLEPSRGGERGLLVRLVRALGLEPHHFVDTGSLHFVDSGTHGFVCPVSTHRGHTIS